MADQLSTPNPNDEALSSTATVPNYDPRNSTLVGDLYSGLIGSFERNRKLREYVRGKHALEYATSKWKTEFGRLFGSLRNNYCRRVVETLADYVVFKGVKTQSETADKTLSEFFEENRFDAVADIIHTQTFQYGECFGILAPDPNDDNGLRFYRQQPGAMAASYDPEEPDKILFAVKIWRTLANSWRLNVYTQEGIFRYETAKTKRASGDSGSTALAPGSLKAYRPMLDEPFVPNILEGRLPVFHWRNIVEDDSFPVSELDDVIPLQDGLNKLFADMMVTSEFQSYRQRWATGIQAEIDEATGKPKPLELENGQNRLMFSDSEKAKFGEFSQADLAGFLLAMSDLRVEIARVSRVPLHHLNMTDKFPSGEALKTAEAPLTAKVEDRSGKWGNVYEDMAEYYLAATDATLAKSAGKYTSEFEDTTPRSRKEEADAEEVEVTTAAAKVKLGVSKAEVLRDMGYDDEKQAKMKLERDKEIEEEASKTRSLMMQENPVGGFPPGSRPTTPGAPGAPSPTAPAAAA